MNNNSMFLPDETGHLSQENSKKYFSRIGLACFILGIVSLLISIASKILVRDILSQFTSNEIVSTVIPYAITIVSTYVIAFPLAALALSPLPKISPVKEKMKTSHFFSALSIAFMLTFVGDYISSFFMSLGSSDTASIKIESIYLSDTELIIHTVFLMLVLPIIEELVFRKFLCSRLLPLGEGFAVFFSSIIFALMGDFNQFPHAFIVGIFFSFIYVKTGKIIYPIILHCAINFYSNVLGLYMTAKLPIDEILEILNKDITDAEKSALLDPYLSDFQVYIWSAMILFALIIAGFIICYRSVKRQKFSLETGIIPPAKEHRISNILLSTGIAAAIGYVGIKIVLPMYVERFL